MHLPRFKRILDSKSLHQKPRQLSSTAGCAMYFATSVTVARLIKT